MALTKITGQVINNTTGLVVGVTTVGGGVSATDGFFSGIVTAIGDASFSGNVSVGGTLTYEDVTNIDAVGLVTARNGIVVGSGITLSKDGDGFFTGVVTATSYRGDGSNLTGISADVVDDTSPQLGGDLDTNGNNISFDDDDQLRLGNATGGDIVIAHKTSDNNGHIENHTGDLLISTKGAGDDVIIESVDDIELKPKGGEDGIKVIGDGAVELYHDNSKKLETVSGGVTVTGTVTATSFAGSGANLTGIVAIPSGGIILWSGAADAIPSGFVLCDGNNSTPDLRNRFVVGAGDSYAVDATGGAATDSISLSISGTTGTPSATGKAQFTNNINLFGTSTHTHSFSGSGTATVDTLPPYYALCYIMKT